MQNFEKVDRELDRVNTTGKLKHLPTSLERIGYSLYCRAVFPPKPGEYKPKQRRVPLGLKAAPEHLYDAVEKCRAIAADLISNRWEWPQDKARPVTTSEFIDLHKQNYIKKNHTPGKTEADTLMHWKKDFYYVFINLDPGKTPTIAECQALIESTQPHTRKRQRYVKALCQLLNLAGIESASLTPYMGRYQPAAANPRDIPDQEAIIKWGQRLPEQWRFFYFLLASFGIRGTEAHPDRCDLSDLATKELKVWAGKGGKWRFVPACSDAIFNALRCPAIYPRTDRTPSQLSSDFGDALRSIGCPFTPYALRHFWAFETLRQGWDTAWSAKCMGHSVALHQQVYWQGIDQKMSREILQGVRSRSGVDTDRT
jgi:integrase